MSVTYTPPGLDDESQPSPSLRIRTPDFSTHEEAEYIYRQKRLNRQAERRFCSIIYATCVITAGCVGIYSHYQSPAALWGAIVCAFTGSALGTMRFCRGVRSTWKKETPAGKEDDSAV
jgi:hypothetical protein